jgi:hypothetical protein
VRKDEIYAATNDRNESEVLCQPNVIEVRPGTLRWAEDVVENGK